jgi:hypothetical protein
MKKKFFVHYTDLMCDQACIAEVYAYDIEDVMEDFDYSAIQVNYINTEAEEQEEK